jgi:hypothetical protein
VADIGEQFGSRFDVVGLAGRDDDLHRQAIGIGQSMDFRNKTAPASSKTSIRVALWDGPPLSGGIGYDAVALEGKERTDVDSYPWC